MIKHANSVIIFDWNLNRRRRLMNSFGWHFWPANIQRGRMNGRCSFLCQEKNSFSGNSSLQTATPTLIAIHQQWKRMVSSPNERSVSKIFWRWLSQHPNRKNGPKALLERMYTLSQQSSHFSLAFITALINGAEISFMSFNYVFECGLTPKIVDWRLWMRVEWMLTALNGATFWRIAARINAGQTNRTSILTGSLGARSQTTSKFDARFNRRGNSSPSSPSNE